MITRDFYYVANHKHVVHFRNECPSYLKSYTHGNKGRRTSPFYHNKPRGKTLCDHCQAIEKRLKAVARKAARPVK